MIKYKKQGIVMRPLKDKFGEFSRFNPGVILKNAIVHMLYRAANDEIKDKENYVSTIGYANLSADGKVLYDSNKQVIFPTLPEEKMGCN